MSYSNTCNINETGLISVIMCNHNTPIPYLKIAIDSVLNQTYSDFEFIIIDDRSTDDSLEFIKSYDDPRIRLICNEQNMGLTRSLNKGLEACRGEYIARMDSDDICAPERFEKQLAYMREHPNTIVCGTRFEIIDEKGESTGIRVRGLISDRESYRIRLLFGNDPTILHPSAFFNRRLLLEHHLKYDETFRYAQDYRMWVDCVRCADCAIIQEYLTQYRMHRDSISVGKTKTQRDCAFRVVQYQLDDLHLSLPEEIKPLHFRFFSDNNKFVTKEMKDWLCKIIQANRKYKVYDQKKLKEIIWTRWIAIYNKELKEHPGRKRRLRMRLLLPLDCRLILLKQNKKVKRLLRLILKPKNAIRNHIKKD